VSWPVVVCSLKILDQVSEPHRLIRGDLPLGSLADIGLEPGRNFVVEEMEVAKLWGRRRSHEAWKPNEIAG